MDKNTFFREAAKRICGTLDIQIAMENCFDFLKQYMPADGLNLGWFDEDRCGVHAIARVGVTRKLRIKNNFLPMPEETWNDILWSEEGNIRLISNPSQYKASQFFSRTFGIPDISVILLKLLIDGKRMGTLGIIAIGNDIFTQNHAEMVEMLHDPLAIAMSNAQKHDEVLNLMALLKDDNRYLQNEIMAAAGSDIIGSDKGLKGVMESVSQVGPLNSPVLILGETGTGKEVIANAIHNQSGRNSSPFIKVNCGAIPPNLIDSELFGHEKGSFTGALSRKRGRFERAHTGTILLDEVGELTMEAQVRLLRILQNKEIERVGGNESINVDIRVIAATNRNLETMVKNGTFRKDLWFRLNVFPISIPPLRSRKEDIPALLNHFILKKYRDFFYTFPPPVLPNNISILMEYTWPGNVRELENIVERVLIHFRGKGDSTILDFKPFIRAGQPGLVQVPVPLPLLPDKLDDLIRLHIQSILTETGGKIHGPNGAAKRLGINASTLRSRMDKLNISYGKWRAK